MSRAPGERPDHKIIRRNIKRLRKGSIVYGCRIGAAGYDARFELEAGTVGFVKSSGVSYSGGARSSRDLSFGELRNALNNGAAKQPEDTLDRFVYDNIILMRPGIPGGQVTAEEWEWASGMFVGIVRDFLLSSIPREERGAKPVRFIIREHLETNLDWLLEEYLQECVVALDSSRDKYHPTLMMLEPAGLLRAFGDFMGKEGWSIMRDAPGDRRIDAGSFEGLVSRFCAGLGRQ